MPANLLLKYEDKQVILNESTLLGRLEKLLTLLRQECQVLEIERDLDDKVNAQMDKGQREYYLREQMHIISEELGDSEDTRAEADTYREKIRALALDEESTEKLLKECDRLARMQGSSAESGVIRSYSRTPALPCRGIPRPRMTLIRPMPARCWIVSITACRRSRSVFWSCWPCAS